jgi:hypothetical protein
MFNQYQPTNDENRLASLYATLKAKLHEKNKIVNSIWDIDYQLSTPALKIDEKDKLLAEKTKLETELKEKKYEQDIQILQTQITAIEQTKDASFTMNSPLSLR